MIFWILIVKISSICILIFYPSNTIKLVKFMATILCYTLLYNILLARKIMYIQAADISFAILLGIIPS